MRDVWPQARRALEEIAAAQQRRAAEERPAKRKRRQVLRAYAGPPSHLLLGARISVYWPDDDAFYKVGRLVAGWHGLSARLCCQAAPSCQAAHPLPETTKL